MYVHVYSLRTNTCRRLTDSLYHQMCSEGVFVNGFIHWIAKRHSDYSPVIVAFSLAHEKFSEMPLHDLCNDVDLCFNSSKLDNFGEKLALAIFSFVKGEVWLMNEYGEKRNLGLRF